MDAETFKRADLRQLCSFILSLDETTSDETKTYKEQLYEGISQAYKVVEDISNSDDERAKAIEVLDRAFEIHEAVCTEVGMKLGARLIFQLLLKDDNLDARGI